MASAPQWLARTRAPRGASAPSPSAQGASSSSSISAAGSFRRDRDRDVVEAHLADAARYPGGHSDEICFPESEADVAALLREGRPLLAIGAQSSLTGGATPRGETLVSTARMQGIAEWTASSVACGAGVVLRNLDEECAARDLYFPPVPTYDGATVGGVVATDAAGAATFKHGTVRAWVDGLCVVLACGEVLELARGEVRAHPDGYFEIQKLGGEVLRVPVPRVAMPKVPKNSAGYRGGSGMDLVDLFVGSEGTLGVTTSVRLRLLGPRPSWLVLLVPVAGDEEAVDLTRELREAAASGELAALSAVEYMDARCLGILHEDAAGARVGVALPPRAGALLLLQLELPPAYDRTRTMAEMESIDSSSGPVAVLCRLLARRGLLDAALPALPGELDRRRALFALREAVPEGVNRRIRERALASGEPVAKAGGDVIVPFERFGESLARYRAILDATGLEAAVWGHISDGNVHPNLLARSAADMEKARAAQVAIGEVAIALGGSPLAEHGTGRNAGKQKLLAALHGEAGVASMRATKRALDPGWQLAPGVLFEK